MSNPLTRHLSSWTATLDYSVIPQKVIGHARLMLADTIAVAVAGEDEAVVPAMRRYAASEQGACAVWGSKILTTARNAALANGAMAHALDFDDNNMSMIGHPSAPVVPAVLALADETRVSLADVLVAYIAGVQIESILGRVCGLRHNNRGWHTISTYGSFAAAAAAARLLKLDATQTQHALCLAASLAGGLRQNFPTMTKAVHAGFGAQNGVLAARLAAAGIRAADDAVEGAEGFLQLFAGVDAPALDTEEFAGFEILENFAKVYPTCAMVHQALDITLDALTTGKVRAADIARVDIETSYHALQIMHFPDPKNVPEARFSWEFCLAVALQAGEVTSEWFVPERLDDPALRALMQKVHVRVAPDQATREDFEQAYVDGRADTRVTLTRRDGTTVKGAAALQKGHPKNPLSAAEVRAKFIRCVAPRRGESDAASLWSVLVQDDPHARLRPAALLAA